MEYLVLKWGRLSSQIVKHVNWVDNSDHHKTIQATQIVLCLGFPYWSVRKISSTDNYFLIAPNVYNINLRSGSIYQHVRKNIWKLLKLGYYNL